MDLNSSGSSFELYEGIVGEGGDSPLSTPRRRRGRRGRQRSFSPIVTLKDPQVGDIVWAKVKNHRWWPAILVNKEDCGQLAALGGRRTYYYVYWYGDGRVSPIAMSKLVDFRAGYNKFIKPEGSSNFKSGVYMAITEFRKHQEMDTDNWDITKALAWAQKGFPLPEKHSVVRTIGMVSQHVREKLFKLRVKYENNDNSDTEDENEATDSSMYLKYSSKEAELISSVRLGTTHIEDICLSCVSEPSALQQHPLFYGSICDPCMKNFMEYSFSVGLDLVAFHCSICMSLGDMMVCSQPSCYRAYCCKCIVMKATLGVLEKIREANPWNCFLCEPFTSEMHGLMKPRSLDWRRNMWQLFHSATSEIDVLKKMSLNILCLDGSCDTGQ
ncbi:hypothetical protein ONE63_004259 [Megalurothrips usitatus]|uniref:DNA (cytosine-5-)-methyltransferase n=1 Tax=Megalurothrips usitatus TaxID=439358 RepID=A0AAV7X299_9NEOP|nr:hypothetical protein ONE63_004259 [Megalurothrips usitatus]